MSKLKMYCLCLNDDVYNSVSGLNYIPVGLGKNKFSSQWLRDNGGENISEKNEYYGEYTFHYWFWKNQIDKIEDNNWIGFCAHRRFWANNKNTMEIKNKNDFLTNVPKEWEGYETIIGQQYSINKFKISKLIKHGVRSLINNPKAILEKNRSIKFHFDTFHGFGNLQKAIDLLDENDREDFRNFTINNVSYNRGNMFICKSKKIIKSYYNSLFPWLKKCEGVFGFNLKDYGEKRIYAFLAERYLSFWFNKYTKPLVWPIIFFDINKNKVS